MIIYYKKKLINFAQHENLIDAVCQKYGINTPLRKAHFLAQIDHESNGLTKLTENLNYTVEALLKLFPNRITKTQANLYGRKVGQKANQEKIANSIYGGNFGFKNLGNKEFGDGWKYKGRAALMCTGKANYYKYSLATGEDFVTYPELILQKPYYLDFAGFFWNSKNINRHADNDDIEAVTKAINGGLIGLEHRAKLLNFYKRKYGII